MRSVKFKIIEHAIGFMRFILVPTNHEAMNRAEWTYPQKSEVSTMTGSAILGKQADSVGTKIIRTLDIIRAKNLIPNAVLRNKYLSSHEH